ncbi:MAG: hypothetical protein COV66_13600 [Nitrospinae bacterium CG11_big_fil_rev_8_21_14_0_20_45_15]|nr:MAG: hypothetical protein COV66_13600 [Nitrospinae bacterium CG11_big_fil_rev_8_21_14_0_20_45_15]
MKNKIVFTFSLLFLLMLSACKIDFTGKISLSDMAQLASNPGQELTTTGSIKLQMASVSACEEDKENISAQLNQFFLEFEPKTCENIQMESYLTGTIKIPVLSSNIGWERKTASVFALRVQYSKKIGGIDLDLLLNQGQFKKLSSHLGNNFFKQLDLKESALTLEIINDQQGPRLLLASDVFLNDDPVIGEEAFQIDVRETAKVGLSDVKREHLSRFGWSPVLSLVTGI